MNIENLRNNFDFFDADNIEKFEKAAQNVVDECSNPEIKMMKMSEAIRKECKIIDNFIDAVFGEGQSFEIFNGKNSLGEHVKIFEEIVKIKNNKQKELQDTFNRYMPNREQKRNNKGRR